MKKNKIVYFASMASEHAIKWIDYFSNTDLQVEVFSLDSAPDWWKPKESVRLYVFNSSKNKYINALKLILFLIKSQSIKNKITHVHYLGIYAWVAWVLKPRDMIATAWGSDIIFNQHNYLKKHIVCSVLNRAKFVTTDAHFLADIISSYGVDSNKIKFINFGIDTKHYSNVIPDNILRENIGIKDTDNVIISLRNHEEVYDIYTLIEAINLVVKRIPNTMCLLFGSGSLTHKYKERVSYLGLDENIKFMGRYNAKDLPKYFALSSVYVSTSKSDAGLSSSTAEAMSCMTPVIITNNSENHKWVDNKKNGYLFENSNIKELENLIIRVFERVDDIEQITLLARKEIMKRNDYCSEMNKVGLLYNEL
jgi:glycosyltransferase involved in cell wall biosynthesis